MADIDTPFTLDAFCCDHWVSAQESGTDCEHYGSALRVHASGAMVCGMWATVHFCPWCGEPKTDEALKTREATR